MSGKPVGGIVRDPGIVSARLLAEAAARHDYELGGGHVEASETALCHRRVQRGQPSEQMGKESPG